LRATEIITVYLSTNSVRPRGKKGYPDDADYLTGQKFITHRSQRFALNVLFWVLYGKLTTESYY